MSNVPQPTFEGDIPLGSPFALELGGELVGASAHFVIYGTLNAQRDNAVLVCHALSGSANVGEWWTGLFGADGAFNLDDDCVICVNVLGSCYGSTGPTSTDPRTGQRYAASFPIVTIRDMVRAQAAVIDSLGIRRLRAVVGGSIGGMQAIEWAIQYPERVQRCVSIGATPLNALGLGLNHLQRQAIQLDPAFNGGNYEQQPAGGLSIARGVAMLSYKSGELFDTRCGRKPNRNGEDPLGAVNARYEVAGYLDYQGEIFIRRFDANTYITLTKAMDTFDYARGFESEAAALARIRADVVLIGISSDWLFPPQDVRALAQKMARAGVNCRYVEIESAHGHDAFLAEAEKFAPHVREGVAQTPISAGPCSGQYPELV